MGNFTCSDWQRGCVNACVTIPKTRTARKKRDGSVARLTDHEIDAGLQLDAENTIGGPESQFMSTLMPLPLVIQPTALTTDHRIEGPIIGNVDAAAEQEEHEEEEAEGKLEEEESFPTISPPQVAESNMPIDASTASAIEAEIPLTIKQNGVDFSKLV